MFFVEASLVLNKMKKMLLLIVIEESLSSNFQEENSNFVQHNHTMIA